MNGGSQASHLDGGALRGVRRARKDRGGEAAGSERAQQERVAALEGQVQWLSGVGEHLVEDGSDGRAAAGRNDRVLAEFGDADTWIRRRAIRGKGGDDLDLA
jgi:hypothetical protein